MHIFLRLFTILFAFYPLMTMSSSISTLPPLHIKDGRFLAGNKEFTFQGINWFGFNNEQTMIDGLWAGGTSMSTDFSTIVYRLKLLGFNSVRLPFTFRDLNLPPKDKSIHCKVLSLKEVAKQTITYTTKSFDVTGPLPSPNSSKCNSYIPNTKTTLERFLWVTTHFVRNGFYVVLDYHPMGVENIPYNTQEFVKRWKSLWNSFRSLPNFHSELKGRILLDLMNEPDSMRIKWNPSDNHPGVTQLYLSTMDALYNLDNPLFLIEGTGQVGYNLCWGNGFVTDRKIIQQYNIDDPNPFFKTLLQKPYKHQVIISPHLYGPTISRDNISYKGPILIQKLNETFGYLGTKGYCHPQTKVCHKFPIILGEFGSFFKDPRDIEYYNTVAAWFQKHFPKQTSWLFWCYNANSADTGGIVKDDWVTLDMFKLQWLRTKMGLGTTLK